MCESCAVFGDVYGMLHCGPEIFAKFTDINEMFCIIVGQCNRVSHFPQCPAQCLNTFHALFRIEYKRTMLIKRIHNHDRTKAIKLEKQLTAESPSARFLSTNAQAHRQKHSAQENPFRVPCGQCVDGCKLYGCIVGVY